MLVKSYTSFLIRFWQLSSSESRIRIEHIQTGEVVQVINLQEALENLKLKLENS